ncbi:unnamed protein product [Phytomonas sp. Hart1]|nr:unnamed protein product [Phytomonas sp. Hart1]|eukprot:CCW71073.1 unnamed protein product [Phytomonas sp. isolate Hart1]
MGAASSKPARQAPVRFVAKRMPRVDKTTAEEQFKKPQFTAQGINTRQDDVNTEPLMYVESSKDANSTELTDHSAPRWYINTYMEMLDNVRTNQTIISGNLPLSWERDKYEPYSLVRDRIDDEDLQWVLAPEQRKMSLDELVQHTKLAPHALQDILDTVELPRTQYRNYKGKLHKSIEDANKHMEVRKEQLERARESEILRQIGYSDEEIAKDEQYLTNRPRGLKTLDDLGVSLRKKEQLERTIKMNELDEMLKERDIEQIESGELKLTEEMLEKPKKMFYRHKPFDTRKGTYERMYAADIGKDEVNREKLHWWFDRRNKVRRGVDKIHGVARYNDRLTANEEQTRQQMQEARNFSYDLARSQGAKGFTDPAGHFEDMIAMMRYNKSVSGAEVTTEIQEDGVTEQYDIYKFPHIKPHIKTSSESLVRNRDEMQASDTQTDLFSASSLPDSPPTASVSSEVGVDSLVKKKSAALTQKPPTVSGASICGENKDKND